MPIIVRNTYIINDAVTENNRNDARMQARNRELRRQRLAGGARGCRGTTIIRCGKPISANKEFCHTCVLQVIANRRLNREIASAHIEHSESD